MTQYTKDDINFHGFLCAMRTLEDKPLIQVARGLYSSTMMQRIEDGDRLPKKLERDRIVARLGVSGDRYEDYLSMDEYELWVQRQNIVKTVEAKEWDRLEEQLNGYKGKEKRTKVEKQFIDTMRFMMLRALNAPEEEIREVISRAVEYTIPKVTSRCPATLLLSVQEINLFIELVHYQKPENVTSMKKIRRWRICRYDCIFKYIDQSCMDSIQKSKVFPKLVYYVCREFHPEIDRIKSVNKCLELCEEAIELLRKTRRSYYLVELLEFRQLCLDRILRGKKEGRYRDGIDVIELKDIYDQADTWIEMLKGLYTDYGVSPYMEDFCYLYWETESYCINDVIRIRRKMLGLSQGELADGLCSEKTLRRAELKKRNIHVFEVRGLFERLGLCPEYIRANVITTNPEVMVLHREVARYNNERQVEKWEKSLDLLEQSLCMEIPQNAQAVARERIMLAIHKKTISKEEGIMKLKDALAITMPLEGIFAIDDWYLTREEISCMHNIAINTSCDGWSDYLEALRVYCEKESERNSIAHRIGVHELLMTSVANHLGNHGRTDESNDVCIKMIKCSLSSRRMRTLARNLYIKCWNVYQINNGESLARDNHDVITTLNRCILLCEIMENDKLKDFFVHMLYD